MWFTSSCLVAAVPLAPMSMSLCTSEGRLKVAVPYRCHALARVLDRCDSTRRQLSTAPDMQCPRQPRRPAIYAAAAAAAALLLTTPALADMGFTEMASVAGQTPRPPQPNRPTSTQHTRLRLPSPPGRPSPSVGNNAALPPDPAIELPVSGVADAALFDAPRGAMHLHSCIYDAMHAMKRAIKVLFVSSVFQRCKPLKITSEQIMSLQPTSAAVKDRGT